jgi:hypothetical protein
MTNALIPLSPGLLSLIQGQDTSLLPFARELVVLECHVAGTSYQDLKEVEPHLTAGCRFILLREAENEFDGFAVAIYTAEKIKLGYLPMNKNETVARLLDAGKMLFALLTEKEWQDEWLKLSVKVYYIDR